MTAFFAWLESTTISTWVREAPTIWAYPLILFLHTAGLGLVVGMSAAICLRLLGVAARLPVSPLERFYRVFWIGFVVNAVSGVLLLIADATTKFTNPIFYVKMACVALGVLAMTVIRRVVFGDPSVDVRGVTPAGRRWAWTALALWAAAIVAGRLMAYLGPVSGAEGLMNTIGQ